MRFWWFSILFIICTACTATDVSLINSKKVKIVSTQKYLIHQQLSITNEGNNQPIKQNLWVALIRDFTPYQKVTSRIISPDKYTLSVDEYDNQYAEFDFSVHPAGTSITVNIEYEVIVNELVYDLSPCAGELPNVFIQPELHIESANPQIVALTENLSKGKKTVCEQVRAFYDYAGDELFYSNNHNAWGAQATFGQMGADCTEYASLVIALNRASGVPARYYEGLLYLKESEKDTQIAQTEHAWLDAYLPGTGWVAMDPTLGRLPTYRDNHFAHFTPNHIIVTTGRNPSTLRGANYWSHLYWPGNTTSIVIKNASWVIKPMKP